MSAVVATATFWMASVPSPGAPTCSIDSYYTSLMPSSTVLNFTAAGYKRCVSLLVPPTTNKTPMPILFVAHGSGGSAREFPAMADRASQNWGDLALKYGFAVAGIEALQFTPGPSPPSPVPSECISCFEKAGCKKLSTAKCEDCCEANKWDCASKCAGTPFPEAEDAVCGSNANSTRVASEGKHVGSPQATGEAWRGGQWLVPEVQNETTGIVCDWASGDLAYISSAVKAMEVVGGDGSAVESDGRLLDSSRLFFTGCSMGSAFTVWASQCYHKLQPSAVSAFGTQSTGLKVKGDGLEFPNDNYDTAYGWGECPTCKYFPAPVVKTSGLKACVADQTDDSPFYESSKALDKAWKAAGMRSSASYYSGGHCQTHSFEEIATCMDDGTGRLLQQSGSAAAGPAADVEADELP